jgi:plastocyanin
MVGTVMPPIRVVLRRDGNPVSETSILWQAVSGGQVNPPSSVTGSDGIATTTVTLPATVGTYQFTGSAVGASGSPQTFTLTAVTQAATHVDVLVVNSDFNPSAFSLGAGGTATFTWATGAGPHNVTPVAPNTIPTSSNPSPPGSHDAPYSFNATFPNPGTFKFYCGVHGAPDAGMHGTITVIP